MFVKLDREESFLWFVNNDPRFASRFGCELTQEELMNFRECEEKYFAWQDKLEGMLNDRQ